MVKIQGIKYDSKNKEMFDVLAALGVIEDEFLSKPAPLDEINFCLRVDLKIKMKDHTLIAVLNQALIRGFAEKVTGGYNLTEQGGQVVDEYLAYLYELEKK